MSWDDQNQIDPVHLPYKAEDQYFTWAADYERIVTRLLGEEHISIEQLQTNVAESVVLYGLELFDNEEFRLDLLKIVARLIGPLRFERIPAADYSVVMQTSLTQPGPMSMAFWFLIFLLGFPPLAQPYASATLPTDEKPLDQHDYSEKQTPTEGRTRQALGKPRRLSGSASHKLQNAFHNTLSNFEIGDGDVQEVLHSMLRSPVLQTRWMSALSLGRRQDRYALSWLRNMLADELSTGRPYSECGPDECVRWRTWIPSLLALSHDSESIVYLSSALATVLEAENAIPMPEISQMTSNYHPDVTAQYNWSFIHHEEWIVYEQQLLYALGYLHAYQAAESIELSAGVYGAYTTNFYNPYSATWAFNLNPQKEPLRRNLWRVHLAMGSLESTLVAACRPTKPAVGYYQFEDVPVLAEAVERRLAEWFANRGMDAEERQRAMYEYAQAEWLWAATNPWGSYPLLWDDARKLVNADEKSSGWLDIGRILLEEL